MKLLFDQHLSPGLVKYFKDTFDDAVHVQDLGLDTADDITIWEYTKSNKFAIVSKDSDFNNIVSLFGFPPKIIWLRKGNCSTTLIKEMIKEQIEVIISFINDTENGILTIF